MATTPPAPLSPDERRQLIATRRAGEEASDKLVASLKANGVYSEDPDPKPVLVIVGGKLVEVTPIYLYGDNINPAR